MNARPESRRAPLDLRTPAAALLVVRAQLGDREALNELLQVLQHTLWTHVCFILKDDDLAADVMQEALLAIARKLTTLRDPRWIRAWAVRIATRKAVRQASRSRRQPDHDSGDDRLEAIAAPLEEPVFEPELITVVRSLVAALPPACQSVVRLRYLDEMSVCEISEALEIPEGTVKSRLAYGLGRLRELAAVIPR